MTYSETYKKAIRLLEGGAVEIDSNWFRHSFCEEDDIVSSCLDCRLDCICTADHSSICSECDSISKRAGFLVLMSES